MPNLFIVDGSNLVTGGRNHPTMTIQALAFRAAEHLIRSAKSGQVSYLPEHVVERVTSRSSLGNREAISASVNRVDVLRIVRIALDLYTQAKDEIVDRPCARHIPVAPDQMQ